MPSYANPRGEDMSLLSIRNPLSAAARVAYQTIPPHIMTKLVIDNNRLRCNADDIDDDNQKQNIEKGEDENDEMEENRFPKR